ERAYDPAFGARPLKRFLQSKAETLLARFLIAENPVPGTSVALDAEFGDLVVKRV
ncbi:MAG: hypothetical protein J6U35_02490, partial [Clostridia bacterium]|nr:hypothetical protein [Clostridia bacterium]